MTTHKLIAVVEKFVADNEEVATEELRYAVALLTDELRRMAEWEEE